MQNTITMQWVLAAITILIGVLGLVAQFLQAGNFTVPAIIALVIGVLQIVVAYLTKGAAVKAGLLKK